MSSVCTCTYLIVLVDRHMCVYIFPTSMHHRLTRQGGVAGGPPVCIKPNEGGQGSGVACLRTPEDLGIYALALDLRLLTIPGTAFSQEHADVHMRPGKPPAEFLLEFFVATDG